MFKRKQKLPRGIAFRKTDPDARWLVKQTESCRKGQARIAKRVKSRENNQRNKALRMTLGTIVLILGAAPLAVVGYIQFVPTSIISQVISSDKAAFLDNLRKSGCAGKYTDLVLLHIVGQQDVVRALDYYRCIRNHLNLPA